jgi:two-component system, NarL family, sensor histidine kinase UhpB
MAENIFVILLALVPALLNVGILIYVLFFLPRSKTTDVFALFVLALIVWQAQDVIDRSSVTLATAQYWESLLSIGWISLAPFLFHFACRYANVEKFYKSRAALAAIYLPFICLQILHASQGLVLFVKDDQWGWVTTPPPFSLDALIRYYVALVVLAAVTILLRYAFKIRKDKEKRNQALWVAIGTLLPTIQGITTQVVMPLIFLQQDLPLTSTFLTFFSAFTVISMTKYRLFNLSESVEVERIMDNFKNIVIIVAPDKKILYMNPYACNVFRSAEDTCFTIEKFFSSSYFQRFDEEAFNTCLKGMSIKNYSTQLQTCDGKPMDVLLSTELIRNNKEVQGVLIVAYDITEQLKTLKALKESNDRYDLIGKATNDMVWDWNIATGEIYRNCKGWKKIFDIDLETERGTVQDLLARVHPDDYKKVLLMKENIPNSADDYSELEYRAIRKDGNTVYLLDRGYALRDENGKVVRLIGATQDNTHRKLAEMKLQQEQVLHHKKITDAVIIAQENERRHIGAELHDNVNQILTSAMLFLNLAEAEQHDKTPLLTQAKNILGTAVNEIRKISHSLIPPSLNAESLTDALTRIVENIKRSGIEVQAEIIEFDESVLSEKKKLAIYRIMQEQFNNINRHSKAQSVSVQMAVKDDQLLLTIKDDGVGFDPSKVSKGVGLTNIRTRTSLHNGKIKITSAPGQGCVLQVTFPMEKLEKKYSHAAIN